MHMEVRKPLFRYTLGSRPRVPLFLFTTITCIHASCSFHCHFAVLRSRVLPRDANSRDDRKWIVVAFATGNRYWQWSRVSRRMINRETPLISPTVASIVSSAFFDIDHSASWKRFGDLFLLFSFSRSIFETRGSTFSLLLSPSVHLSFSLLSDEANFYALAFSTSAQIALECAVNIFLLDAVSLRSFYIFILSPESDRQVRVPANEQSSKWSDKYLYSVERTIADGLENFVGNWGDASEKVARAGCVTRDERV